MKEWQNEGRTDDITTLFHSHHHNSIMASKLRRNHTIQLTDWPFFTNNGNFNYPLPSSRRSKKRNTYFILEIDSNYVHDRQSAIIPSTRTIVSALTINYLFSCMTTICQNSSVTTNFCSGKCVDD